MLALRPLTALYCITDLLTRDATEMSSAATDGTEQDPFKRAATWARDVDLSQCTQNLLAEDSVRSSDRMLA